MQSRSDGLVEAVFQHFPLAIALVNPDGSGAQVNEAFAKRYDPALIAAPAVRTAVASPEGTWRDADLGTPGGSASSVRLLALPLQDRVMLVIDDAPQGGDGKVEQLRARVAELELESATDPLTGVWNRLHLDRVIETEVARSVRFRQPLSLVLMDIDHFKLVNDAHGHQTGDTVLKELVSVARTRIRSGDTMFRWGGEEFVVLAPSTGYRAAATLAESLRAQVAAHDFPAVGQVTISLGVAEHLETETVETWFARADAALYKAKAENRNRVIVDRCGSSDAWAHERGASVLAIEWLEAYECGEPTIDTQHRELIRLGNALISTSFTGRADEGAFLAGLDALIDHINQHFADEELLLERWGYAKLPAHRRMHQRLRERALGFQAAARARQADFSEVLVFLVNELIAHHLFTADCDFFPIAAAASTV